MDYLAEIREFHRLNIEPHLGKPVGCSEAEVSAVEASAGFELPLAYKQYLLWMGKDYYGVFMGSDWHLKHLANNNKYLPKFLVDHKLESYLPEHYFACFSHQGYSYVWFELPKLAEDPPIWYFNEAMLVDPEAFSKPVDGKPQQWGTLTEVILTNLQSVASTIHITAPYTLAYREAALTGNPIVLPDIIIDGVSMRDKDASMTHISTATPDDYAYLAANDHHISAQILQRKIAAGEVFIAKYDGKAVGWLRYSLFWDSIPLMNMLFVEGTLRGRGIGARLVSHWEAQMSAQGFTQVMTTTLSNESAQHFYRKLGYHDVGALLLPDEPLEIIQLKDLTPL